MQDRPGKAPEDGTEDRPGDRPGEGLGPGAGAAPHPDGGHPSEPAEEGEALRERGRGRDAWRPHRIELAGWRDIVLRAARRVGPDLFPLVAAGVAFFGMLALFPAIAPHVSVAGNVVTPDVVGAQFDTLEGLVSPEPFAIVRDQAVALAGQAPGQATATALVNLALSHFWGSRGIDNLVSGINMAHAEVETRNIMVRNLVSLALTGVLAAMALAADALPLLVPPLAAALKLSAWTHALVRVGRWPLLAMVALGLIDRYAPARRPPRWNWVTPGAVVATVLWLGGSVAFSVFVRNFASYQPTYGALAGVVILLLYIRLAACVVLLGALLNAQMEPQSACDTTRGPVRPMGRRGAVMADTLGRRQ